MKAITTVIACIFFMQLAWGKGNECFIQGTYTDLHHKRTCDSSFSLKQKAQNILKNMNMKKVPLIKIAGSIHHAEFSTRLRTNEFGQKKEHLIIKVQDGIRMTSADITDTHMVMFDDGILAIPDAYVFSSMMHNLKYPEWLKVFETHRLYRKMTGQRILSDEQIPIKEFLGELNDHGSKARFMKIIIHEDLKMASVSGHLTLHIREAILLIHEHFPRVKTIHLDKTPGSFRGFHVADAGILIRHLGFDTFLSSNSEVKSAGTLLFFSGNNLLFDLGAVIADHFGDSFSGGKGVTNHPEMSDYVKDYYRILSMTGVIHKAKENYSPSKLYSYTSDELINLGAKISETPYQLTLRHCEGETRDADKLVAD